MTKHWIACRVGQIIAASHREGLLLVHILHVSGRLTVLVSHVHVHEVSWSSWPSSEKTLMHASMEFVAHGVGLHAIAKRAIHVRGLVLLLHLLEQIGLVASRENVVLVRIYLLLLTGRLVNHLNWHLLAA